MKCNELNKTIYIGFQKKSNVIKAKVIFETLSEVFSFRNRSRLVRIILIRLPRIGYYFIAEWELILPTL